MNLDAGRSLKRIDVRREIRAVFEFKFVPATFFRGYSGAEIGARGIGELFNIGTIAAVLNAVHDATGVRLQRLPVRSEEIYAALRGATV